MPYISKEKVSEIRKQIKKEFPASDAWKFSILREHSSCIRVAILWAPFDLTDKQSVCNMLAKDDDNYEEVNEFYIKETYKYNEPKLKVLTRLMEIMNGSNGVLCEDADYGTVPNYYTCLSIGSYNIPFKFMGTKELI